MWPVIQIQAATGSKILTWMKYIFTRAQTVLLSAKMVQCACWWCGSQREWLSTCFAFRRQVRLCGIMSNGMKSWKNNCFPLPDPSRVVAVGAGEAA